MSRYAEILSKMNYNYINPIYILFILNRTPFQEITNYMKALVTTFFRDSWNKLLIILCMFYLLRVVSTFRVILVII